MSRTSRGQALLLLAVMLGTLCLVLALAIDTGIAYVEAAAAQRAASAGALSGVVFMPYQFDSSQAFPNAGDDATDRAILEAKRNGFDVADSAHGVTVVVSRVSGHSNRLQVTVTHNVPFGFGGFLQQGRFIVSRTAVAEYLPPIGLGQSGPQLGSTVSQLGPPADGYYFLRTEGWATDRQEGDSYTPNPAYEYGHALSPPSTDVHLISVTSGVDTHNATLPDRGGENFRVVIPTGYSGSIQVYNAVFAPEVTTNYCENARPGTPAYQCASATGPYYMHENDSFPAVSQANDNQYSAMRYTVYQVRNLYVRSTDNELSQMTVDPISVMTIGNNQTYHDINTGRNITQTWDGSGNPSNMKIYHSWINVTNYTEPSNPDLVQYTPGFGPLSGSTLPAGTYRLRVDTIDANDAISGPGSSALAHKGYAIRVVDGSGNLCSACTVSGWNDMTIYTPVRGGTFAVPMLNIPPDYAGKTISIGIYDLGDIASSSGYVNLAILDPSGNVATATAPQTIAVYDLGVQRSNPQSQTACVAGNPTINPPCLVQKKSTAAVAATVGQNTLYNGQWLDIELPIPADYNPGTDPNGWWWSLQYNTPAGTTANDTFTVAIGFGGVPSHLVN